MSNPKSEPTPAQKSANPNPNTNTDLLLHIEHYLARRDGIDKLLKLLRYSTKLLLATNSIPQTLAPNFSSFDSSLSVTRKAFRLGKFIQSINSLRFATPPSSATIRFLNLIAYGGEAAYYFIEQFVWLSKSGLISKSYSNRLTKLSAWCELIGYVGSVSLKLKDLRGLGEKLLKEEDGDKRKVVEEKILMKKVSIVQDLADGLMALSDVRDGKGVGTGPVLMATAGLLSGVISTHKNWKACS